MSRVAALLMLVLAAGPAAYPAHAKDAPTPCTPAAVDAAIERGVTWILDDQKGDGSWGRDAGKSVLATFALLHAGLREDTPGSQGKRMQRAWRWLDRFGPGARPKEKAQTYATSLMVLALDVRGRDADRARMQRLADWLVAGQAANGQWTYALKPGAEVGDNSNTQFAVLALGVAGGLGLRVPRATIQRARAWWQGTQQARGGFGYASGGSVASAAKQSMTAAGISSLAILDSALHRAPTPPTAASLLLGNAVLRSVYDWMAQDFSLTPRPIRTQRKGRSGQSWPHYYLWTLERALVLLGVREINRIDWFTAGTRRLLNTQKKDGSWRGEAPLYATSFALLFLTRAADPPRVFTSSAPVTGTPSPKEPTPSNATGTVADWLRAGVTPTELASRCQARGPGSLVPLVKALDDTDRAVRRRAYEALSRLLPAERIHGVDRHPLPRARLSWYLRRNAQALTWHDNRFRLP